MPHFKTETFSYRIASGERWLLKVKISVNADGLFYCQAPDEIKALYPGKMFFPTYTDICGEIRECMRKVAESKVVDSLVIRYNIKSYVRFAVNEEGRIYPNATTGGAEWLSKSESKKYGSEDPWAGDGGYSLTVGAKCYTKSTTTVGDKSISEYWEYSGDGIRDEAEDPAALLNAWCGEYKRLPSIKTNYRPP